MVNAIADQTLALVFADANPRDPSAAPYHNGERKFKRDIVAAFGVPESRIQVVLNGIDTEMFKPIPGIEREPFHLITTASADQPLKGTPASNSCGGESCSPLPGAETHLYWHPKPGGRTEQLIHAFALEQRIEFHHGLSFDEIKRLALRRASP